MPLISELDGIAYQVHEDLLDPLPIGVKQGIFWQLDGGEELNGTGFSLEVAHLQGFLHDLMEREPGGLKVKFVELDLGQVQDVLHQTNQEKDANVLKVQAVLHNGIVLKHHSQGGVGGEQGIKRGT
jgi:hypothetical protein